MLSERFQSLIPKFNDLNLIEIPKSNLPDIVWNAKESVMKVETLDSYGVPDDDRLFRVWSNCTTPTKEDLEGYVSWFERVNAAVKGGIEVERIHIVPSILTDYLRFEIEVAYLKFCIPNGEKVGIVNRDIVKSEDIKNCFDYYLIDSERLIVPKFGERNSFAALFEVIDPHQIQKFSTFSRQLKAIATNVTDYYKEKSEE